MAIIFAGVFHTKRGAVPVVRRGHGVFSATAGCEFVGDGASWAAALGLLVWIALVVVLPLVYGREYLASRTPGVPVPRPSTS
jgi:hypothetical protein